MSLFQNCNFDLLGNDAQVSDSEPYAILPGPAAKYLGVSSGTIADWADQGRIPHRRTVGGHRRFRLSDLKTFYTKN